MGGEEEVSYRGREDEEYVKVGEVKQVKEEEIDVWEDRGRR